jgi:hypothetical protein
MNTILADSLEWIANQLEAQLARRRQPGKRHVRRAEAGDAGAQCR